MFETIAVLSMIIFATVGVGLFVMNRQAQNDDAAKHRQNGAV